MEVKQIYQFLNDAQAEVFGESSVAVEDLQGIVALGTTIANAVAYEKFANALVNRIGRTIFSIRAYEGGAPKVLMDAWEFGSIKQKIICELPDAQENETWELADGQSYDPNIFKAPKVSAKYYNEKNAFEIQISITNEQLKQSFLSVEAMNSFIDMLYNAVDTKLTIYIDMMIMRTINNFIGESVYAEYQGGTLSSASHVKAVNLLYEYNQTHSPTLTASTCLQDPDFLRWATYRINRNVKRLGNASKLYNIGGKVRYTPKRLLHLVVLSDFAELQKSYLQSSTYHKELVELENYEEVPYWQGSGTDDSIAESAKVNVTTSGGHTQVVTGVLAVMFDRDALGVTNYNRRTTSDYNARAEFTNTWFKCDVEYFNDQNENFVVYFVA